MEFNINDLMKSDNALSFESFKISGPDGAPGNYSFQVVEQKLSRLRDKRATTMNPLMLCVSSTCFT